MYKKWTLIDVIKEQINDDFLELFEILLFELYEYYKLDSILYGTNHHLVLQSLFLDNSKISYLELARKLGYKSKTSISRSVEKIEKNIISLIKFDKRFYLIKEVVKKLL